MSEIPSLNYLSPLPEDNMNYIVVPEEIITDPDELVLALYIYACIKAGLDGIVDINFGNLVLWYGKILNRRKSCFTYKFISTLNKLAHECNYDCFEFDDEQLDFISQLETLPPSDLAGTTISIKVNKYKPALYDCYAFLYVDEIAKIVNWYRMSLHSPSNQSSPSPSIFSIFKVLCYIRMKIKSKRDGEETGYAEVYDGIAAELGLSRQTVSKITNLLNCWSDEHILSAFYVSHPISYVSSPAARDGKKYTRYATTFYPSYRREFNKDKRIIVEVKLPPPSSCSLANS